MAYDPQDLSNTAWSIAALSCPFAPLRHSLPWSARPTFQRFGAQNISNTAWSCSVRRVRDAPLLQAISSAARRRISDFDTQALANTAWASACLLISHDEPLVQAIAAAARRWRGGTGGQADMALLDALGTPCPVLIAHMRAVIRGFLMKHPWTEQAC